MNPYPMYFIPPPYSTTYVNKSFPEHHLPLEHTRHKIGHALHDWWSWDEPFRAPKADIRETLNNYYIDVELPGIQSKDQVKVKWTNNSTLLVEAIKGHIPIPEEKELEAVEQPADSASKENDTKALEHRVHSLVRERDVGKVVRAFNFPIKVNHEDMTANLQHGMLILRVPKAEETKVEHKEVEVEVAKQDA